MKAQTLRGAQFLAVGLTVGVALTFVVMHSAHRTQKTPTSSAQIAQHRATEANKLIAAKTQSPPPGAASAQESKPATQEQQAGPAPARWLTPADVLAEQQALQRASNATPSSGPPPQPQYQSSNTTYYVYSTSPQGVPLMPSQQELTTTVSGYEIPVGSGPKAVDYPLTEPGPWTMGGNGLLQNPCVDPPSTRGRAYTYAPR